MGNTEFYSFLDLIWINFHSVVTPVRHPDYQSCAHALSVLSIKRIFVFYANEPAHVLTKPTK